METPTAPADLLRTWYAAALAASAPGPLVSVAMSAEHWGSAPAALLAIGKAAPAMLSGAATAAERHGGQIAERLTITTAALAEGVPADQVAVGDHPVAGPSSSAAAERLSAFIASLPVDRPVHLLLSGGASALIGSPVATLSTERYRELMRALLHSGLAIDRVNAIRARLSRWGGGRLAEALAPRSVSVWLLSDVPGDDPAVIGSGPCHPLPPWRPVLDAEQPAMTALAGIVGEEWLQLVPSCPGPVASVFERVRTTVVGSNATARAALAAAAGAMGIPQRPLATPLIGEAADVGRAIAIEAMRQADEWVTHRDLLVEEGLADRVRPVLLHAGGETTVTLHDDAGLGGRSQELALAAAAMLEISRTPITLLAAGTDGVDGPTDAAGAVVDHTTWGAIEAEGMDPAEALAHHDSHRALDRVGALLRPGPTGGNVMDLVAVVIGT